LLLVLPLGSQAVSQNPLTPPDAAAQKATPPQKGERTIRVDVDLVLVPVTVLDPYSRLITGLGPGDFRLYEDGVEQEITHIYTEQAPISVGLVYDVSGSMKPIMEAARRTAMHFLRTANPQDQFLLVEFRDRAQVVTLLTSRLEEIEERMMYTSAKGQTAMVDGIYLALNKLRYADNQRRAVIVVSDGEENHSRFNVNDLYRAIKEADVQIYAIGADGLGILTRLCEMTGGRHFGFFGLENTSETIWNELRNQYVLAYRSSNRTRDGKWRKIKVKIRPQRGMPKLLVHAKSGYYAPAF
jgi:Ca-activated chloride channel family protein